MGFSNAQAKQGVCSRIPFPREEAGAEDRDSQTASLVDNLQFDFYAYSIAPSSFSMLRSTNHDQNHHQAASKETTAVDLWTDAALLYKHPTSRSTQPLLVEELSSSWQLLGEPCINHISEVKKLPPAILTKKDTLYRPLMRLFRRYFRKDALSQREYDSIHEQPIQEQGLLFANALKVPHDLWCQPRTQYAILLLVDSHRIMRKKKLVPICQAMMGPHLADIKVPFFTAFNEGNRHQRMSFFSDPLI